ncbi:membrane protein [Streptomyces griseoviridis]|uniref:Membrane protein n=2 Tax=Streptomyces griseoviridis TaxID=45398 RepID=A0A918G3X2_STRGD|nr:membrane protein [Streptomyces niveoruber]
MRASLTVAKLTHVYRSGQVRPECEGDRMETPVFEEIDPASDCDCPGCRHGRRAPSPAPARPAARRALVVAVGTATACAAGVAAALPAAAHAPARPGDPADETPAPAPVHDTPQGERAPLHGPAGAPASPETGAPLPETTRAQIIERAKRWVAAKVPYSMTSYWSDGYRQDCSGYVSMAWGLPANEWTGSLGTFSDRITKDELQPGDILLFHNEADPEKGSHVVIFGGWTDTARTQYTAYEQTPPHTRQQTTPYAYWNNSSRYLPYRYKGVVTGTAGGAPAATGAGYPGRAAFRPGVRGDHVTRLGEQLVKKGFGGFYPAGPGPRWGEADRRAVEAFQRAQGWRGGAADGFPGPETWRRLFA